MNSIVASFSGLFVVLTVPALSGYKPESILSQPVFANEVTANAVVKKITFDLSSISSDGLIGPRDGLRSLSYEFCIPAQNKSLNQVKSIDPSVQISRSRGRIGCTKSQYLVIGDTHQPQWHQRLVAIASLNYVQRIDQFFGE